ncbi:hypothetical protein BAQ49_05435 [Bacillus proteolyticus]|uniref:DUF3942 domain-containing protein n=1 Tax=Bacillus proteolyticus TaxID=2026192 RepID=A0AA44KX28_9BACI|nr:DUF3942 family protein [Bacillus proteolyticus]OJE47667.1 hypothetical protein BAQ49_05435 [Bacillus proteolyticus]
MMTLDATISRLKSYIGEVEEDMLFEKFDELSPLFQKMCDEFPLSGEKENLIINLKDSKYIKIEDTVLRFVVNQEKRVIDVEQRSGTGVTKLDELYLLENELYSSRSGMRFSEWRFNSYLKEVFAEILD